MQNIKSIVFGTMIAVAAIGSHITIAKTTEASKEPLSVHLSAYQIKPNAKGEMVAEPVTKIKPNDVIEYRATYTNNTANTIRNLKATLPIPTDTQFLAKSAPAAALASTDGVNFAPMPLKRKIGTQLVNVPLQEYRALRWTIAEVPAGQSTTVSVQTRVNTTAANR